ncbi:uncharacterized protein LOC127796065 isoform X3 [Diospyros lotus]|uniref:uncharacterized protein LOC127796065 isoform X3 n=1 Tax=Diospyros lotus TaxID=55363 RepID=UPI002255BD3B|nr:uncharacterized protein LOC127796065 isoform X3 [Diospyros lotus]
MPVCCNRSLNVFHLSSLFSVRTFVEHLSALTTTRFNPNRTNRKPLTTKAAIRTHFFESLNPLQKDQIHLYVDTLLQWNRKMNLTAVTEASEVMERHVEDSLAILPPIRSSYSSHCEASYDNLSLVDVGSGAGLPGLILAIACPGWKVTLLESINKRCLFLEHAVGVIGLPNVQVIRERAENFGQNLAFRETFDVAVARAVAELRILAEYCLPLVQVGGLFVAAKGHDPLEEVSSAKRAIQLMGASVLQIDSVESHSPYGQRTAVLCLKDRPTPKKYPRDPGIPAKSPL